MLVEEKIARLKAALERPLNDQVVVRYAVRRSLGAVTYQATLMLQVLWEGHTYFGKLDLYLSISTTVKIDSNFHAKNLTAQSDVFRLAVSSWSLRSADDWLNKTESYVGMFEVRRDGQPYTGISFEASDKRWHVLTGAILGEIRKFQLEDRPRADRHVLSVLQERFAAFTGQSMCKWAEKSFRN